MLILVFIFWHCLHSFKYNPPLPHLLHCRGRDLADMWLAHTRASTLVLLWVESRFHDSLQQRETGIQEAPPDLHERWRSVSADAGSEKGGFSVCMFVLILPLCDLLVLLPLTAQKTKNFSCCRWWFERLGEVLLLQTVTEQNEGFVCLQGTIYFVLFSPKWLKCDKPSFESFFFF